MLQGDPIHVLLASASTLPALAQALGRQVLARENEITAMLAEPAALEMHDHVARGIASVGQPEWEAMHRDGSFLGLVEHARVDGSLRLLGSPDAEYSVLRALCLSELVRFYGAFCEVLALEYGTVFPLGVRATNLVVAPPVTPHRPTLGYGHLLGDTGFRIWRRPGTEPVRVELDFRHAIALDEATWLSEGVPGLPTIATVHPYASAEQLNIGTVNEQYWFDVAPNVWDPETILQQLKAAKQAGAKLAVLPELSLPNPDALHAVIRGAGDAVPRLVVCGSAHTRGVDESTGTEVRSNECAVLLDGREILRHAKAHPFRTDYLGPEHTLSQKLPEGITREQKTLRIAAGTATRLAVAICADLNDELLPEVLSDAGANLVLVPALTAESGAFHGACSHMSSKNQAVVVVANGTPGTRENALTPFLALVSLPNANAGVIESEPPSGSRRRVAVIDPAQPPDAVRWLP